MSKDKNKNKLELPDIPEPPKILKKKISVEPPKPPEKPKQGFFSLLKKFRAKDKKDDLDKMEKMLEED
ncbi:hypothetical protein HQ529_04065, partial [Candidatus Woesearchaeota archaeon]|nr:hypothetical protein [Candidatus Woesearchaeota archaeon]